MIGIRQKLMLGFGSLLVILAVLGALTMTQITSLGDAIQVIMRENYRSVIASQEMKEALERIDSGVLFSFAGSEAEGRGYIDDNNAAFTHALSAELNNITLPGEQEKADQVAALFVQYRALIPQVTNAAASPVERQGIYFSQLLPLFQQIKKLANEILEMNQANMVEAKESAQRQAAVAHRQILIAILACALMALLFSYLAQRWILIPIKKLIVSATEIRNGNLDLMLEVKSHDEIGLLSKSFNEMTIALRHVRRNGRIDLIRTRRATEEIFKALPAAIAVIDLDGRVETATATAEQYFGLRPGADIHSLGHEWLPRLVQQALDENRMVELQPPAGYVQRFDAHRECFFQPMVVPIPSAPDANEPAGAAIILKDVTQLHEQQELKRDVVATVSHQLKTPLTSLRMSVHLLLEERIGTLNDQQADLLLAAREDSERLALVIDDLLDLSRIESGRARLNLHPLALSALVREAIAPFFPEAKDKAITLINEVSDDLPEVMADAIRIQHVFANLMSNAFRFTEPQGTIVIKAKAEAEEMRVAVQDSGRGIPAEFLHRIFQPFFRAPGQDEKSGVGLGLAIVKEIVRAHGGQVGVESEWGQGAIFYFTLPLATAPRQLNHEPPVAG